VVKVAGDLDLIEVAVAMSHDDKAVVEAWLTQGLVSLASTEDAIAWMLNP